jgi:hypothetical protein
MKPRQWMQIAALASAMGLTGTAIAQGADRTPGMSNGTSAATLDDNAAAQINGANGTSSSDNNSSMSGTNDNNASSDLSGNASSSTSSDVNGGAGAALNHGGDLGNSADVNASPPSSDVNGTPGAALNHGGDLNNSPEVNGSPSLSNGTSTGDVNGQVDRGATQGSTMTSPQSGASSDANAPAGGARYGSGSSATTIGGQDRLGNTNSDNFNTWMSDYASQHNGHITRQEFLSQMGNRWDRLDAEHQGYLTPVQVQEILIITPAESSAPARTGSDVQPGDMGPSNSRGK